MDTTKARTIDCDLDTKYAVYHGRIGSKRSPQWTGPARTNNMEALKDAIEAARERGVAPGAIARATKRLGNRWSLFARGEGR